MNGQNYTQKILDCIEDCSIYDIPTLIMHPTNGNTPLPNNNIGVERLKKIVEKAERFNVNIALENMQSPEYIDYIFSRIQSIHLGFCFDSGHCNLYTPELDLLTLYGDKLMALHLHDNNRKEDQHALPFAGNINWYDLMAKLRMIDYMGAIALEVRNTGFEHIKNPNDFLKLAFESTKKIINSQLFKDSF